MRQAVARVARDVTDAELAILQVLWESGPSTRRHLTDVLYPGGGASAFTTVQKLLERLEEKKLVRGSSGPAVRTFTAIVDREQLISRRLHDVAEKLCGGSLTPLLMNLVRGQTLTAEELAELQELIRQHTRSAKSNDKPRS
jgi:predicted transcriptional regulator